MEISQWVRQCTKRQQVRHARHTPTPIRIILWDRKGTFITPPTKKNTSRPTHTHIRNMENLSLSRLIITKIDIPLFSFGIFTYLYYILRCRNWQKEQLLTWTHRRGPRRSNRPQFCQKFFSSIYFLWENNTAFLSVRSDLLNQRY